MSGGPSSLPTTPLHSSTFVRNPEVREQDDSPQHWTDHFHPSPTSRCPTFKEYAESIKQLKQENFQLKVRVFLSEQKSGMKVSNSDFNDLVQQNAQQLQSALNSSLVPSDEMKTLNEELNNKISELQQKITNYEAALAEKREENKRLIGINQALSDKIKDIETELTLTKGRFQKLSDDDSEMEKGAAIAFGGVDDEEKLELEMRLTEESTRAMKLEEQVGKLLRKVSKYKEAMDKFEKAAIKLKNEKSKLEEKIVECSKVFVDLGKRNVSLSEEIQELKLARDRQAAESSKDSFVQERYSTVREVVSMLQGKMREVFAFVDAMFKLEAKNVFSIAGLQEEHREKLRKSLEQCRNLSHNLDELFHYSDVDNSSIADKSVALSSTLEIVQKTHCDDKLVQKLSKSERHRKELLAQQETLKSQIESLKHALQVADARICQLQTMPSPASLEAENKNLSERLFISDNALKKLHQEHAKLVGQLKSMQKVKEKCSVGDTAMATATNSYSPDLGIDSGPDGTLNSDEDENRQLRKLNKELATKLRQTRQVLQATLEKLNSTTKQKEQVEKAVCRQLHKTHTILREARHGLGKFTTNGSNACLLEEPNL